jgi:hypothetical protein
MILRNGNISLLQFWHESSNPPSRERTLGALGKEAKREKFVRCGFSWMPLLNESIQPCHPLMGESPIRVVGCSIDCRGLRMQVWLWSTVQRIDLVDLSKTFRGSWQAAMTESDAGDVIQWDDVGPFMRTLIQVLRAEGLANVEELIVRKGARSTMWHELPVSEQGNHQEIYLGEQPLEYQVLLENRG